MWATAPQMPTAIKLMEAWGFQYKTVAFTWIKHYPKSGSLCWGMGNYTRANAEYVLLGVKGKPKRVSAAVHSVVNAPRGEHSAKPHEVNKRITELLGEVPRAELFARHLVEGWDCFGIEINDIGLEDNIGIRPELEYCCPTCDNNKIEEQFWININIDKPTKRNGTGTFFCTSCNTHQKSVNLTNKLTREVIEKISKNRSSY